jgi:hypothetical protein
VGGTSKNNPLSSNFNLMNTVDLRHMIADKEIDMMITLYRKNPNGSLAYYTMHDRQPVLHAPFALTTAYRVGNGNERQKLYVFEKLEDMDRKIRELFGRRIRAGYRLLYSFSRDSSIVPETSDGMHNSKSTTSRGKELKKRRA